MRQVVEEHEGNGSGQSHSEKPVPCSQLAQVIRRHWPNHGGIRMAIRQAALEMAQGIIPIRQAEAVARLSDADVRLAKFQIIGNCQDQDQDQDQDSKQAPKNAILKALADLASAIESEL